MTPERWARIKEIFTEASERQAAERSAFLDCACGGDERLRAEVERLLVQDGESLKSPAGDLLPLAANLAAPQWSPGTLVGPYRIDQPLGEGGMGYVYKARDTRLGRDVAIKTAKGEFSTRFQREARAISALNHPNICTLHDVGPNYLVMELIEGSTLAERMAKGVIPLKEALGIARQIAEALEAAHEKGIVHRDLKPPNVKLTAAGTVKVLDFGLAKAQDLAGTEASPTITATQPGQILGTPAYMSPEQAQGEPVDKRADIWSFGVILWEMLTGHRLFEGETAAHTLASVLRGPIEFHRLPDETPAAIRGLLRRCLDRDSKTRLRDIGEARIALTLGFQAPEPAVPPARPRSLFVWMAMALSTLFALALGALAFVHFHEAPPDHPRMRVQIAAPQEGETSYLELSPDGKFLSVAVCVAFACKIWIRPLDSLEAQFLTDGSARVFWSPDSRYFVFRSADKLYKMVPRGGPPVLLADVPPGYLGRSYGGVWLDGGIIVLATPSGFYTVPDSGGTLTRIGGQGASYASWLPGRRFLYSNEAGVFAGSLLGDKPVSLLPDNVPVTYVPPPKAGLRGYLVFVRRGTLLAQEFDTDKLQLHGDAISIAASGSEPGGAYVSSATASRNGSLAFRRGNVTQVVLTWLDRSGRKLQTAGKPFNLAANATIRLSPDDSRAIVDVAGPNPRDLWIADLTRDTFSRFTFAGAVGGLWSPDGQKILWGDRDFHHYLRAADGSGNSELLYKNPQCPDCIIYDWSRDGKLSSFGAFNGSKVNIWLAPLDGDRKPLPYRLVAFNDFYGMFSADSRWLAYTSDESGRNQIYIESIPAGKKRWQVSNEEANWPIWRRDGKELFYRQGSSIIAVPVRLTETAVEIGKPQSLFTVSPYTRFQVSHDGQRFLIALPVEGAPGVAPITIDTDWRAGLAK